jgi:hypothetical protein
MMMRKSLTTSVNTSAVVALAAGFNRLRSGRAQISLIASLAVLLSIGVAVGKLAADEDPMNPSLGTPMIDPFQSYRHEIDPGSGIYQFTIAGALINVEQLEGRTIEVVGGPFTATTTTDSNGAFSLTYVMDFVDGYGQSVCAVLEENGTQLSEIATLTVE